jgi:integrase
VAHLIPGLGKTALAKLTPSEIQTFLKRRLDGGLSPRRVRYIHAVLGHALVTAEKWGMVSRNVAKLVDPPRVPKHEITPLTPEQARTLIESAIDDRHLVLYVTALGTGLRQGELLGLRWEDVDLDAGRLRVRHTLANVKGELTLLEPRTDPQPAHGDAGGTGGHRSPSPPDPVADGTPRLRLALGGGGHVFTTLHGTPYHAATITGAFQAALERAGLPRCRFHDLRHAAATFLLAQGMTLEDVKGLLGHSSITLTSNTYGHVLEQRQRQVARAVDAVLGG